MRAIALGLAVVALGAVLVVGSGYVQTLGGGVQLDSKIVWGPPVRLAAGVVVDGGSDFVREAAAVGWPSMQLGLTVEPGQDESVRTLPEFLTGDGGQVRDLQVEYAIELGLHGETRTGTVTDWDVRNRAECDFFRLGLVEEPQDLRGVLLRVAAAPTGSEKFRVRLAAVQWISEEDQARKIEAAVVSFGLRVLGALMVAVSVLWMLWRLMVREE